MFHYRWAYKADIDQASGVLPSWRGTLDDEMLAAMGKAEAADLAAPRAGSVKAARGVVPAAPSERGARDGQDHPGALFGARPGRPACRNRRRFRHFGGIG